MVRRTVSNEEFKKAQANKDNQNIINDCLSRYKGIMTDEDLKDCATDALWRCLGYHQDGKGNKFTTSLWTFLLWESSRRLKKINKQKHVRTINISTIETRSKFEIETPRLTKDIVNLNEAISSLSDKHKEIIQEYYFDRKTIDEIGYSHGYSKEAARLKIKQAVKELRKLYLAGV